MSEEIRAGHGGRVLGVLCGLRSVLVLGVLCAGVAGCADEVKPYEWRAAEVLCATNGGVSSVMVAVGVTSVKVTCRNGLWKWMPREYEVEVPR